MPNHKSSEKRMRQEVNRRSRNKTNRSRLRTQIKLLRTAIAAGDADQAKSLLLPTTALIDKSVQKGVIHANAAARYTSRLTRQVNSLS